MKSPDLTQAEVEQLGPNAYSNYLANGTLFDADLSDEEYERHLKRYQLFDL
jgi:hypothetical protein